MNYEAQVRRSLEEAKKVLASRSLEEWRKDLPTFNRLKAQVDEAERYLRQKEDQHNGGERTGQY